MGLLRVLVPAVIIWTVGLLFSHIEKKNDKELLDSLKNDKVVVHLPRAYLIVGIAEVGVCLFFLLIYVFQPPIFTGYTRGGWWVYAGLFAFSLLGFSPVLASIVWRITFDKKEDCFVYRTFLGRKYVIDYRDCVSFRCTNNVMILYTKSKTFYIDPYATNIEIFQGQLIKNKVNKQ